MQSFFYQRRQRHQKQMQRYLKYVFNDHFALLLTFAVGGLGFYYSNTLKTVPQPFALGRYIVVFVLFLSLFIGKFASLVKPADQVFLLPKESQMNDYLKQALIYSCYLPFALLFLITGAIMPLFIISTGQASSSFLPLLAIMWVLKWLGLKIQAFRFYQKGSADQRRSNSVWLIISLFSIMVSVFFNPYFSILILVMYTALCLYRYDFKKGDNLQWLALINFEQHRLQKMYQVINLFTDVPQIEPAMKRRRYLNWLIRLLTPKESATFFYLYLRRFIRSADFSHLYLRLMIIGLLFTALTGDPRVNIVLGSLFIYVTGSQLLPLYYQVEAHLMPKLYPISIKQQVQDLQKILFILLGLISIVFSLGTFYAVENISWFVLSLAIYFAITAIFCYLYVPKRLKIHEKA